MARVISRVTKLLCFVQYLPCFSKSHIPGVPWIPGKPGWFACTALILKLRALHPENLRDPDKLGLLVTWTRFHLHFIGQSNSSAHSEFNRVWSIIHPIERATISQSANTVANVNGIGKNKPLPERDSKTYWKNNTIDHNNNNKKGVFKTQHNFLFGNHLLNPYHISDSTQVYESQRQNDTALVEVTF